MGDSAGIRPDDHAKTGGSLAPSPPGLLDAHDLAELTDFDEDALARVIALREGADAEGAGDGLEPESSQARNSSDERLRDGLAIMAHEVRGPLVAARAAVERALYEEGRPGGVAHLLGRAWRELDTLARQIDRLLAWGAGLGAMRTEPTDLGDVTRTAIESCVLETGQDRVHFVSHGHAIVDADGDHLRGAIANLIRNALVYSPADARVEVFIECADGFAELSVADGGPGVPLHERQSIFDALVQGRAGRAAGGGGGLGLFVTRSVVEGHGGSVSCGSNDRGATFRIRLPLSLEEVETSAS